MKYVTIASSNHKHFYVGREMIGGTFTIIATCTNEDFAKRIASAMNAEKLPKGKLTEEAVNEQRRAGKTWPEITNQSKRKAA